MRNEAVAVCDTMIVALPPRLWIRQLAVVAVMLIPNVVVTHSVLRLLGVATGLATGVAAVVGALSAGYVLLHLATSGRQPSPWRRRALTALWSSMIGVVVAAMTTALLESSPLAAGLVGVVTGLAAAPVIRHWLRAGVTTMNPFPTRPRTFADADAALRAADARLRRSGLDRAALVAAEVERASALALMAVLAHRPDHLDEAVAVLDGHARSPDLGRALRFRAACALVEARSVQAERTRDGFGYPEALELERSLATDHWEHGRVRHDHADYELFLARRASEEGGDASSHLASALSQFRKALQAFGPGSDDEPILRFKIAQQVFLVTLADPRARRLLSLTHEIRDLRATRRLFRGRRRDGREYVELALAQMLLYTVDDAERVLPELDEAELICTRLTRGGRGPEVVGFAHDLLAEAARLRLEFTPQLSGARSDALRRERIAHLKAAFEAHRELSIADAADAGRRWARAVAAQDDVAAAADAYAHLARQVPVEVLRRIDPDERAAFVAKWQGIATEAGYWLSRDERFEQAVDAIENARAILLGQRAQRLPAELHRRLCERGRDDLYATYREAVAELGEAERRLHTGADGWRGRVHVLRGRYERITWEIADVLGGAIAVEGHVAARDVARADGAVVYLGAAERGGFALVVLAEGPAVLRELPLTRDALNRQLAAYRSFLAGRGKLTPILAWAWAEIMEAVVAAVPSGTVTTLVPLGGIAMIPLHAAEAGDGVRGDGPVVRYAPSARMALQARADAVAAARRQPAVLAVSVTAPPPLPELELPRLRFAVHEAEAVCRSYPHLPTVHLADATKSRLLEGLPSATVWHIGCHGLADPEHPLDSFLALADGPLTVREIMAQPAGHHRLAVLSSCESAVPDPSRLDEVIGFPGALLQAGVAAVVASWWPVDEAAAGAFSRELHASSQTDGELAAAVARTHRWLRTVTRGELHDRFGDDFEPMRGTPPEHIARWRAQRPFERPRHWAAFALTGI